MKMFLTLLLLIHLPAQAITVEVLGKYGEILFKTEYTAPSLPVHVGDVSIQSFEIEKVPYKGTTYGITEIFGLSQDLELISDSEMKAHGWCFSLDGVTPSTLIDETLITSQNAKIQWYYAYAHYVHGEWTSFCEAPQPLNISL